MTPSAASIVSADSVLRWLRRLRIDAWKHRAKHRPGADQLAKDAELHLLCVINRHRGSAGNPLTVAARREHAHAALEVLHSLQGPSWPKHEDRQAPDALIVVANLFLAATTQLVGAHQ